MNIFPKEIYSIPIPKKQALTNGGKKFLVAVFIVVVKKINSELPILSGALSFYLVQVRIGICACYI